MLQRDADAYEIAIADVYVRAGVISVMQSNITDTRLNSELCGIVHGTIKQVDTTEIFRQYQAWFLENKSKHEKDFEVWMNEFKIVTGKRFTDWVNDLKNSLDPNEDIAAQLQMQISENKLQLADITTDNKRLTKDKTITGAINELFTSASNGKTKVATAITGKGVPASGSDSYDTLSNKIKNIKTGYTQNDLINIENVEFSIKIFFLKIWILVCYFL